MRFLFEYRYSKDGWTLVGYEVIVSTGIETACFEFERYMNGQFLDYEVYEVGKKLK